MRRLELLRRCTWRSERSTVTAAMAAAQRHVVFVDDDSALLDGLRYILRAQRDELRMTFLGSGADALALMAGEPVDVVVTDTMVRGIDGMSLLEEVRDRWPDMVRIVLSGYSGQAAFLRSSTVAHQCLTKPCDPIKLISALRTACTLSDRLARPQLRRLLGGIDTLPSPPRSFLAINAALSEPDACAASVSQLIEQDAGVSAKMLQLVNSAFFGLSRRVTTVHDAVTFLGLASVRSIVLASELSEGLGSSAPDLAPDVEEINEHSLAVAVAARELVPADKRFDAFTAGMLHDVGRLAVAASAPGLFRRTRDQAAARDVQVDVVEREILEATHADLGAYLLQMWGLPLVLIEPVARHHDADALHDPDPVVAAVATAEATVGREDPEPCDGPAEDDNPALPGAATVAAKSGDRAHGLRSLVRALISR